MENEKKKSGQRKLFYLFFNPGHNQIHGKLLLLGGKRNAGRNMMPFAKASAAAGCGGMLSHKNRMVSHRRLLAVVGNNGRRQPFADKIFGMPANGSKAFFGHIRTFLFRKSEPAAKR